MADPNCSIAIVGAGFSGTVTAIHLLRQTHAAPLRIHLIDKDRHARGIAYADQAGACLLNVPAARMSAFASDPLDFLRFAQRTLPAATGGDFLPRTLYGAYLEETLASAERAAPAHVRLERVRGAVSSLDVWRPGDTFILGFADGREMTANQVVLALGNPPPKALPGTDALRDSRRLLENPWCDGGALCAQETVLMVGTGLTMADIVTSAVRAGHAPAQMHAMSRHGLVPPSQSASDRAPCELDAAPLLRSAATSLRQLYRVVRRISREVEERGGDWRDAISFVRGLVPSLWARLPAGERRRFLRHVRSYWDIHRHRLPAVTRATLDELQAAGRLTLHAGRILRLEPDGRRVRVIWRPRATQESAALVVDRVINCTGPDYRCAASGDPLIRDLLANGLIQADQLGTGLRTAPNGGAMNRFGRATPGLYYIGPMLRAQHWEATAVLELREHAERLAHELLRPAASRPTVCSAGAGPRAAAP